MSDDLSRELRRWLNPPYDRIVAECMRDPKLDRDVTDHVEMAADALDAAQQEIARLTERLLKAER